MPSWRSFTKLPRLERLSLALAVAGCVWFALASAWGIAGMPLYGHLGSGQAGNGLIGENVFRWKSIYPAWQFYTSTPPTKNDWMCSHPYGMFWLGGLSIALFGHHDFALPLPAVLMSAATPPLLYGIARPQWGRAAGAAAVWGFAVLPLTLGFARFQSLEVLCIFGIALFFWGHTAYQRSNRPAHLVASLAGVLLAGFADWPAYLILGTLLGWGLLRVYLLPAWTSPPTSPRAYGRWWALSATLAVLAFVAMLALFYKGERIDCWLAQAHMRSGASRSLRDALAHRRAWIDAGFTPAAILVGKLAAPVALGRMFAVRRDEEVYSLAVLVGATVQYVVFANGADVHPFWPQYFGLYFALAFAQLVRTVQALAARTGSRSPTRGPAAALACTVALIVVVLPDGVRGLRLWRATGGNYTGRASTGGDLAYVLGSVVAPSAPSGATIDAHVSAEWSYEHTWAVHRAETEVKRGPAPSRDGAHPFWIGRSSRLSGPEAIAFAKASHVRAYGDVWVVDQREAAAPLDAYSLHERAPSLVEWYLYGQEPVRHATGEPDPWRTWEWRVHLEQPATAPSAAPNDLDEVRIAHNAAVEAGDQARMDTLRRQLVAALDAREATDFDDGLRFVGSRIVADPQPRLEVWFESPGPLPSLAFVVTGHVVAKRLLSSIPMDEAPLELEARPSIPTELWRANYLYRLSAVLSPRIGVESYDGRWKALGSGSAPARRDGRPTIPLGRSP